MKFLQVLCVCLPLISPATSASAQNKNAKDSPSTFTIDRRMEMPGETLKPGKYTIQILDHLSDRMIVRIANTTDKRQFVLLAIPAQTSSRKDPVGLVPWQSPSSGTTAVRGFVFPSGYGIEFVYPKSEAAALAKVNDGKVIAIDPESEGRPTLAQMSSEDMTVVHLWMLSLTSVGSEDKTPAIHAQAYQAPAPRIPVSVGSPKAGPKEVASIDKSAAEHYGKMDSPQTPRNRPAVATLPHTASDLPLIYFLGIFFLLMACCLHVLSTSAYFSERQ